VDLRLTHSRTIRNAQVQFEADILNVLNLVNSDWGLQRTIPPVSSVLTPLDREPSTTELISEWSAGILPIRGPGGDLITPEPWSIASPASQWQAQFGLRVVFGGGS
jgi:hypothetical protein